MFQVTGVRMDEGTDGVDSIHDEGQSGCSTRVNVLGIDQIFSI